jgi:hypothetical protein
MSLLRSGALRARFQASTSSHKAPRRLQEASTRRARAHCRSPPSARRRRVEPYRRRSRSQPRRWLQGVYDKFIKQFVDGAKSKVATGGNRVGNKGYFFEPTVVTDVSKSARAMNEEPFGPLALISPFSKFDDAAEEANRLPFGLASYAFAKSAKTASGAAVEAGMMSINSFALALPEVPFGGIKDSGYGSEGGSEALEAYLNTKFITQTGV